MAQQDRSTSIILPRLLGGQTDRCRNRLPCPAAYCEGPASECHSKGPSDGGTEHHCGRGKPVRAITSPHSTLVNVSFLPQDRSWLATGGRPHRLHGYPRARERNRTADLRITSALLCRLSYSGEKPLRQRSGPPGPSVRRHRAHTVRHDDDEEQSVRVSTGFGSSSCVVDAEAHR